MSNPNTTIPIDSFTSTPPVVPSSSSIIVVPSSTRITTAAPPPVTTSVTTAPAPAGSTAVFTVVTTQVASGSTLPPETVVITRFPSSTGTGQAVISTVSSSSSSALPTNGSKSTSSGGLSSGATVAIAVVIAMIVIALLVLFGLWFWRRRKQRKSDAEQRKEEMEEYGYNPNHDPTLPTVAATDELAGGPNDSSGYRGWGAAGAVGRKTSTLGNTTQVSDGGYNPASPGQVSDLHSGDTLAHDGVEPVGALGVAGAGAGAAAAAGKAGPGGIKRGPSNASSSYSAGDHSSNSIEPPMPPIGDHPEYYTDNGYGQGNPYDNSYGAGQQHPVIRDNPARRNTRIQEATVPMHQGASGIAQNF